MLNKSSIIVAQDALQLAKRGADIFARTTRKCASQGRCVIAISGGSTPRTMHRLLTQEPFCSQIPWSNVHLCWVDERMVPYDNSASNFGASKKDFLETIPIPSDHIHPMPIDMPPEEAAVTYQKKLAVLFKDEGNLFPPFDLIFLGIGQDGHTASLFPGQASLDQKEKWVVAVKGGTPNVYRLTMTLPLLNQGRSIVFLVSGRAKASVVRDILENQDAGLPAQRVGPTDGKLTWLLDSAAASLLSGDMVHD
jgi:6-phosphogluconolactonase